MNNYHNKSYIEPNNSIIKRAEDLLHSMAQEAKLETLFGLILRVSLKDSTLVLDEIPTTQARQRRVVLGNLLAVDHEGNILLDRTEETIQEEVLDGENKQSTGHEIDGWRIVQQRFLGMLTVPRNTIEKVEIEKKKFERFLKWQ